MQPFQDAAKHINDLGLWSALSAFLQLGAVIAGLIFIRRRRRLANVNFTFAIAEGHFIDKGQWVRQLTVIARNLSGTDLLVGSALLRVADRTVISEYANGNSSSAEYELKFKTAEHGWDNGYALIKSSFYATTWLPASETVDVPEIIKRIEGKWWRRSYFRCKVIVLTRKPQVYELKMPMINIQHRPAGTYYDPKP